MNLSPNEKGFKQILRISLGNIVLFSGLSLAACSGDSAPVTSATEATPSATVSANASSDIFINECGMGFATKPESIILACADGNLAVQHISWLMWEGEKALGRGTFIFNDCEPDCADGKTHLVPVQISLLGVAKDLSGRSVFTQMQVVSESDPLPGGAWSDTYDLWINLREDQSFGTDDL